MIARSNVAMFATPRRYQHGQALTEATVALGALAALLWAVYATGVWQDDSLRAGLAARQSAFVASRLGGGTDSAFDFNHGDEDIAITFVPVLPEGLPDSAQPGGAHAHAATLRRDWGVSESAVMAARAGLVASQRTRMAAALGDIQSFTRHSVVLSGAGHAGDDAQAHARIAASDLGWQIPAQASMTVAQALDARMQPVDAAWARPALETDWLQKWTDITPPNPSSQALLAGEPSHLRLPAGSVRNALGESLHVYGLPLRVEIFQAPTDLATTADTIVSQLDTPPSLLVSEGAWVLSWRSEQQHWAVRLTQPITRPVQSNRARTHGTVSVLHLPDDDVSSDSLLMPTWLPTGARLLFVMADGAGKHAMRAMHTSGQHSVYAHDLPPVQLWPLITQGLRRAGWQGEAGATMPGGMVHYTRGSHTLALLVVAVSGGSGVLAFEAME